MEGYTVMLWSVRSSSGAAVLKNTAVSGGVLGATREAAEKQAHDQRAVNVPTDADWWARLQSAVRTVMGRESCGEDSGERGPTALRTEGPGKSCGRRCVTARHHRDAPTSISW